MCAFAKYAWVNTPVEEQTIKNPLTLKRIPKAEALFIRPWELSAIIFSMAYFGVWLHATLVIESSFSILESLCFGNIE